ncbi:PREDICTED: olfactory receptor 10A3-like [Nanorana parkeri]|uniref:olfactory receptor 10A3-like n=1 Tax=Nanorana parkeri TaxID=125878 RepID=UPI0008548CE7|nr:PREDICTED: olfactory receptor 10A3-like [Nanorana parkeri]
MIKLELMGTKTQERANREKSKYNQTQIKEVILLGFQSTKDINVLVLVFLFIVYILTLGGNLLIITLVSYSKTLHTPMYFFLIQISISDIMLTTDISPNFLYILLHEGETMNFTSCIFQYYIFVMTECTECLLLTVMSYDRYLAICNPLQYIYIMNESLCIKLTIISWLSSICSMMISTITIAGLDFCGPNIIDHFFCDVSPLLKLSCSDTFSVQLEMILLSVPILFLPFLFIVISYIFVIFAILKIPSSTGKQKAFSTCSSHVMVVSLFYVTLIVIYDLPTSGQSLTISKLMSLLYTVGTPLMNPIIYSLRNKDVKFAFNKLIRNCMNL